MTRDVNHDQSFYDLHFTDAEWAAWREGASVDDILAARPHPSLKAWVARLFKAEPEAGL